MDEPDSTGLRFEDRAGLSPALREEIRGAVAGQRTLEDVVRWSLLRPRGSGIEEVIRQDEFTFEVLVPFRDGLYLVYDTT